jgi:hypothetical protein
MAFLLCVTAWQCSPTSPPNPLQIPSDSLPRSNEEVIQRILETPHHYFRFINTAFAREVCRRFANVMPSLPTVNLHGDAHLEQFAVTPHSAGLADFDDSATGPAVIDLVRFGVSIQLTLRQQGWSDQTYEVLDAILTAYSGGLEATPPRRPSPAVVQRMRSRFTDDQTSFLDRAESMMAPVSSVEAVEAEKGYARYVDLILRIHPDWSRSFFELKKWGALTSSGIGSATTRRYVVRIEGPTSAPGDDVILEAKELRDLTGVPCIDADRGNALRVIAGSVRFGRQPDPFLAIIPRGLEEEPDDPPWWIQSWSPHYSELDILDSLRSPTELVEVVDMVGVQMAQGHTNLVPPPYDAQLRELVKVMLMEREQDIRESIDALTVHTLDAHRRLAEQFSLDVP